MQPLAVHHAHAAHAVQAGVVQECAQQQFGLARVGAVQVELLLYRDLAAPELLQQPRRDFVAAIGQRVTGIEQAFVQGMAELFARLGLIALGHARPRPWPGRRRWRRGVGQPPYRTDRGAEQLGVVVFGIVSHGDSLGAPARGGQGAGREQQGPQSPSAIMGAARSGKRMQQVPGPVTTPRSKVRSREFMRVLVSNDDGVDAPGIRVLAEGLRAAGHEVLVVAPDRDRSGASNSLTLDAPVRVQRLDESTWRVYGTPTDCVHVAITGMLEVEPDIVVSGINNTANLGDDVIYSGTVAAAMEGRFLGLPAVAMSLQTVDHTGRHYETAARAAVEIIARLRVDPLPADTILNVNVPDVAWADVRGFEVTRLGNRHRSEACIPQQDPRGRQWWWIGPAGAEQDAGPGTDFHAVRTGHISITPIQVDLTRYHALEQVASWVDGLAEGLREDAA